MKVVFYQTLSGRRPVEDFILGLSKTDQVLFKSVRDGIENEGLQYPFANFKHLEGKVWEVKFKGLDGSYRIAYVLLSGSRMIWLHAFKKKTQRTSPLDLTLALKRMKEVFNDEKG
jgi:phage-related protein